ncbi:hypothetical protein QZH41_019731, partial [Actinostola sp. cb2023]
AAQTTDAWIFTGGTNTGVMKHVGEAVRGQTVTHPTMDDESRLHVIGIATWGIIDHRETLITNKDTVTYHMTSSMTSSGACLDNNHTHFILVDNGSTGKYGVEISFRASLENAISKRKLSSETSHGIPVVLLVLEGGPNTIITVLESVTRRPAVPVVIAEGSGRAADILAFAHRFIVENEGPEIDDLEDLVEHRQLLHKIELAYPEAKEDQVFTMYKNILKCVGKKRYITIFRADEEGVDIDRAILKALLKAEQASPADQLRLALVWNRADIAVSEIFVENQRWKMEDLESAMMDALTNDRVEFVSLLLGNGVSMGRFLSKERLLALYRAVILHFIIRSKVSIAFQQIIGKDKLRLFTLQDIDLIIDRMLGGPSQVRQSTTKYSTITVRPRHDHGTTTERPRNDHGTTTVRHDHGTITTARHDHGTITARHDHDTTRPWHDHGTIIARHGTVRPRHDHGTTTARPRHDHGTTTARPRHDHSTTRSRHDMTMARHDHGTTTVRSRHTTTSRHDYGTTWHDHGTTTARPRNDHSTTTTRPQHDHGTTTARPRYDHGTTTVRPRHDRPRHETDLDQGIVNCAFGIESDIQHPYDDLFLWAVLCNMQNMALFTWERGDNNLACALVGARLYMEMAGKMKGDELRDDVCEEVTANAKEFKDVALSLLDECSRVNEIAARKLLTYHLSDWCGHTCLTLAVMTEHEEFVAHASCQSLLTEIWMGAMRNVKFPSLKIILGFIVPPTIYFLDFKTKRELSLLPVTLTEHRQEMAGSYPGEEMHEEDEIFADKKSRRRTRHESKVEARSAFPTKPSAGEMSVFEYNRVKTLGAGRKLLEFYRAPITKFWSNVIAYMLFLMLFSYVILVTDRSYPIIAEVVLVVFICSLCSEEIRQILQSDVSISGNRFIAWASSKWNICDGLAVLFFFVGLGLRLQKSTASIGHVVYSLDIMLWIIRLLDIFSVSKHLGPYVVMIGRMTVDMLYFLIIMVVFMLAYGVAQQAILNPNEAGTWGILSKIFFRPYFQTYGELFITDPEQLVNSTKTEFDTPKYNDYSGTIATIIMAFYLLVANILLLNLLIAIFNNTFAEVQANSNQIWKFQRYNLIMEYAQRPVLVPPLIILNHVIELVFCAWKKLCCCYDDGQDRKLLPDNRLKLFLDKQEQEELLVFEEHCLYLYLHHKDTLFNATSEERMRVIGNRVEFVASQLDDMAKESFSRETSTNKSVTELSKRIKTLEQNTKNIIKMLTLNPERFGIDYDSDDEDGTSVRERKSPAIHIGFRKPKRSRDYENQQANHHIKARRSPYPMTTIERYPLKDSQVSWKALVPWYNPQHYTADTVLAQSSSADPDLQSISTENVNISFNEFDGKINRKSYVGTYDVINGLPRNPIGRTGLAGRGLLEHWGPNHMACHIITRYLVL